MGRAVVDLLTENEAISQEGRVDVEHNPRDPRIRSFSKDPPNLRNCVYIQGLVGSVTESRIKNELFEDFGDISDFWLSRLKKHCFVYVRTLNI